MCCVCTCMYHIKPKELNKKRFENIVQLNFFIFFFTFSFNFCVLVACFVDWQAGTLVTTTTSANIIIIIYTMTGTRVYVRCSMSCWCVSLLLAFALHSIWFCYCCAQLLFVYGCHCMCYAFYYIVYVPHMISAMSLLCRICRYSIHSNIQLWLFSWINSMLFLFASIRYLSF